MPSYVPPKKNTAYIVYASLISQTSTKLIQANPTLAAGDFKVSIDGGAMANLATLPTVTPAAGSMVKISLSAAEMNGDNISIVCIDAAGAEWCSLMINIQTSVQQVDDLATPTNITAGTITTVGSVAAGGITAASIATNAIDADALATDAVNEIVNAIPASSNSQVQGGSCP